MAAAQAGQAARPGRVALPSLAAGAALALSLPPWGWWPLAFAGAALLYWRLAGLRWPARLLSGWLAGLSCYVPGLWWARSFNWYGAAALMAVEALAMAAAAVLVPAGRGRLVAYPAAFTLLEAVRMAWPFGGLPLGGIFLGQAGGPLLGTARLGGPLLLTALVWLGGAGLGQLALHRQAGRTAPATRGTGGGASTPPPPNGAAATPAAGGGGSTAPGSHITAGNGGAGRRPWGLRWAAVLALAAVVAVGVAGALAPDGGPAGRELRVAAVQGGGRRGTTAEEVDPSTVFSAQLAASAHLPHDGAGDDPRGSDGPGRGTGGSRSGRPAELVVWPEDVIALSRPLAGSPQAARMSALARRLHATVLAGVTEPAGPGAFRNLAVAWGPDGRVVGTYEKVHRVPFGEYVPDRGFFAHFATLAAVPLTAVPGHGTGLVRTPAGPLGVMLSYEVFYAGRGQVSVAGGAQLLVVPTNTSSYAASQVPAQEVAADRVQAVEEGRDLVQAAPTGYSTVVDPAGDVLRRSVLGRRQVLLATVGLRTGRTVYSRLGNLPVLVLAALALAAAWLSRRKAGRAAGRLLRLLN